MAEPILNEEVIKDLKKAFEQLEGEVTVSLFTQKGLNDQYNEIARQLITEIAAVDKRIKPEFHETGGEEAQRYGISGSPTLLICPEKYRIMFRGAPLGEEGRTLVMSLILASTGQGAVQESSVKKLQKLKDRRLIKVFVSPT
jgi:thioredoxin reductase (NADPH)